MVDILDLAGDGVVVFGSMPTRPGGGGGQLIPGTGISVEDWENGERPSADTVRQLGTDGVRAVRDIVRQLGLDTGGIPKPAAARGGGGRNRRIATPGR